MIPPKHLEEKIKEVGEERINICLGCKYHSKYHKTNRFDDHCTHCGCTLAAKTKCLSCSCPIGKWKEVLTSEQEDELEDKWKAQKKN